MEFTGLGVFAFLDTMSIAEAGAFAQRVEELGYHALWFTEGPLGRDALVHAASLLTRTKRMIIGTGVASVWARPAATIAAGARTNAEVSGDRFALGIGVNNPVSVAMRGRTYGKPLEFMAEYVGALKAFKYTVAGTAPVPPIVIGAQNPKMLELAGRLADGALTYFVTPAHTAHARRLLGPGKRLIVEQAVLLESDANKARTCVRDYMAFYLSIPGYSKFLMSLGFDQRDLVEGGSDFLVDAIVAWGGRDALRARLDEHRNAGADQVCILPLDPAGGLRPDLRTLEALASK
jgi:probable F420-dependent oxidoreductase